MRIIYKYKLKLQGKVDHDLKIGASARVVGVGFQDHNLYLWAEVDPEENGIRYFQVFGTGQELYIPEGRGGELHYIGHARVIQGKYFEFFVYERKSITH